MEAQSSAKVLRHRQGSQSRGGYSKGMRLGNAESEHTGSFGIGEDLEFASKWYGKIQGYLSNEEKKKKHSLTLRKWAWHGESGLTMGEMGSERGKWV